MAGCVAKWFSESLAQQFPGCVCGRHFVCTRVPKEKVTLWVDLLHLRSCSGTNEGVVKDKALPEPAIKQEPLVQGLVSYPLSQCFNTFPPLSILQAYLEHWCHQQLISIHILCLHIRAQLIVRVVKCQWSL